jgi:Zn-dependent M28 family amino/carboxypeptidase
MRPCRLLLTIAAAVTIALTTLSAQRSARIDVTRMMTVVRTLASPAMEGRLAGTDGDRMARQYIRDAFEEIGLQPAGSDVTDRRNSYYQRFSFTSAAPGSRRGSLPVRVDDAANVVGRIAGRDVPARVIVVSAHYDHVGIRNGTVYPGADDNASGVAALLECARYLRQQAPRHTILFVAFDGEELGLQGARTFVRMPPVRLSSIALDLNFDMVSRSDRGEIFAAGTYHYPSLKPILDDIQRRTQIKIQFGHDRPPALPHSTDDWTLQSDHGAFHQAGVPFVYFGVEDHPDYHAPTDTADRIDPAFFGRVAEMLLDAVIAFDQRLP